MLTTNVHYSYQPDNVIVNRINNTYKAHIDMPVNIQEIEDEEGNISYVADVYSLETGYTANLKERVEANYNAWIEKAAETPIPQPTIQDVIDAVNVLAEMIVGDE